VLDGPGQAAPAEYRRRLKALADEGDALEADLARRSGPMRALSMLPPPAEIVEQVAAALPRDGVLIDYIAYEDRGPAPALGPAEKPAEPRYLALVLFSDGRTGVADLGPAAPISLAAASLRDALAGRDAGYQAAAQEVYRLAFKPLLPLLRKRQKIFLVPDGQLSVVPFGALHDGRGFLADTFDFTYLTGGRDLLVRPDDHPRPSSVVVLADPDFGAPAGTVVAERSAGADDLAEHFFSGERGGRGDLPGHRWVPLPGTRQEGEAIRRLVPEARVFLGPEATKERLLHLPAPAILHVATHGFFLEDAAAPAGTRGLGVSGPSGGEPLPRLPDPLLRSGLVLAGASASTDLSSSLVTALELTGMDLWGTELVVLSACDTGRGDVKIGQGVYGLRRALVIAGAETLVVSLWKVDDETTRGLMEGYYRNLRAGQGRVAALRGAMRSLRATHPHPHDWAPFIALGRNAPLRAFAPRP